MGFHPRRMGVLMLEIVANQSLRLEMDQLKVWLVTWGEEGDMSPPGDAGKMRREAGN